MVSIGMATLTSDPSWPQLNSEQTSACALEMGRDLLRAYKDEDMDSWMPQWRKSPRLWLDTLATSRRIRFLW